MDSPTQKRIRQHVAHYLAGQETLADFRRWLLPLLWRVDRVNDIAAFDTVTEIALYLAEYDRGHRTESEVQGLLGPLLLPGPSMPSGTTASTQAITVGSRRGAEAVSRVVQVTAGLLPVEATESRRLAASL